MELFSSIIALTEINYSLGGKRREKKEYSQGICLATWKTQKFKLEKCNISISYAYSFECFIWKHFENSLYIHTF